MTFVEAHWYMDHSLRAFCYVPPGDYDEGVSIDPSIIVPWKAALALIPELEAEGLLKPKLDQSLRTEDLKITHRLLDIIEHKR